MTYHVYIIYSKNLNRFYIGYTNNLNNRIKEHNGRESKYTSGGTPWALLWSTTKPSVRDAENLEFKLKNLTRVRKIRFMRKYAEGIHDLDLLNDIIP
jgi:putative endonuclease